MDVNTKLAAPLAAQGYARARPATEPSFAGDGGQGAQGGLAQLVGSFADTLKSGEEAARATLTSGADPHALVQALAASQLAVETAVTLRDKVVEAYQEILRMPV